ncbi:hypothetical protein BOX15_Mlig028329g1, partial [Macrostomum lignano]
VATNGDCQPRLKYQQQPARFTGNSLLTPSNMRLAKLRSLDEFLGRSSRFQLPDLQHQERWSNRVQQNLLYYQTNYMAVFCLSFIIFLLVDPASVLCGCGIVGACLAAGLWLANGGAERRLQFRDAVSRRPALTVALSLACALVLLYCLRPAAIFLLAALLPLFACLVHASLRLRSVSSKVSHKLRGLRSPEDVTPMEFVLGWLTAVEAEGLDL